MSKLVVIAVFDDQPSAQVARAKLDAYGIPAVLPDANFIGANWHWTAGSGGIRLMVPAAVADEATALLAETGPATEDDNIDTCPACSSGDVFRPASPWWGLFGLLTAFVPLPIRSRDRICRKCGHRWHASD